MKKIAVVTGGTRGIGKAVSLSLARNQYKVFSLYARNSKAAEELKVLAQEENLDIIPMRGDLTKDDLFTKIINDIRLQTDVIDCVVHAAASGVHRMARELSLKHLKWTFDVNVFSIHHLLTELFPLFKEGTRIIGITSGGGSRVIPYYAAVGSSKGALEALFRHYAHEWASQKIAVNLVCPGMILTDAVDAFPDKEERIQRCLNQTPTKELTTVDQVASLVTYLATNDSALQIIGQNFIIDGGKCLIN